VAIDMPFLQFGRKIHGVIQGESHPADFIPRLVDYLMDGRMPIERIVTFYDLADINQAAADSANGTSIKPVIRMPR
jgi:aryl-alcohol dehydrogenase